MPKYLYVYHGGGDMPESEEEGAKVMQEWMAWFGTLGDAVVDGGNPTTIARTVSAGGVADGGGSNPTTGYSVVSAASIDDAVAKARGCPIVGAGGSVEVCEILEMG